MGTVQAPEALVAVVHEKGGRGSLESFIVIMMDTLFHEMLTIDRFALAIPVPEENGEIPRQRIRLFVPQPEFEAGCETHDGRLDEPAAVIGYEFLEPYPGRQLADERNQHRQHVRNTGEPREIGSL